MMRLLSRLFLAFLIALAGTSLLLARQKAAPLPSIEAFLSSTDSIFVGKVVYLESTRQPGTGLILTRYLFQVEQSLKGSRGGQIEIVEYGGRIGHEIQTVSHTPRYLMGREYLVFSSFSPRGRLRTFAGEQGRFDVVRGSAEERLIWMAPGHPLRQLLEVPASGPLLKADDFAGILTRALEGTLK